MELKIQKLNIIRSVDDWQQFAPPMSPAQWKNDRSAKLLAEWVLDRKFDNDLEQKVLKKYGFHYTKDPIAEPECITRLPGIGEGRHHDLLIEGDDFVIGVEAKVSETFGNYISEELYKASDNKVNRITELAKILGKSVHELEPYRYQLLTGVVGTLLEAQARHKPKCLFHVIVFKGDSLKQGIPKGELGNIGSDGTNAKDFNSFCKDILGIVPGETSKTYKIKMDNIELFVDLQEVTVERASSRFSTKIAPHLRRTKSSEIKEE